ncbi:MAG: hypothetical protein AMXMBFR56_81690 [Polyangiaceae bacterium]
MSETDTTEHVVLSIPRGEEEELRVVRAIYEGRPYTSIRVWYQTDDGWRPTKKGVSVRDREISQVIDALSKIARKVGSPASAERRANEARSEKLKDVPRADRRSSNEDRLSDPLPKPDNRAATEASAEDLALVEALF